MCELSIVTGWVWLAVGAAFGMVIMSVVQMARHDQV